MNTAAEWRESLTLENQIAASAELAELDSETRKLVWAGWQGTDALRSLLADQPSEGNGESDGPAPATAATTGRSTGVWLSSIGVEGFRGIGRRTDLLLNPGPAYISPWVLAGDPCVDSTRIPTAAIFALRQERGLDVADVIALYPDLAEETVEEATALERRLHGLDEIAA